MRKVSEAADMLSLLPADKARMVKEFVRKEIPEMNFLRINPDKRPERNWAGFCSDSLALAMMASDALRRNDRKAMAEAETIINPKAAKTRLGDIETPPREMGALGALRDAASSVELECVLDAIDYLVVGAVGACKSVRDAKEEAVSRSAADPKIASCLSKMYAAEIRLMTELEAVERASMLFSHYAAMYISYYVFSSRDMDRNVPFVESVWNVFQKKYVFIGTKPSGGDVEKIVVCAKWPGDYSEGVEELFPDRRN